MTKSKDQTIPNKISHKQGSDKNSHLEKQKSLRPDQVFWGLLLVIIGFMALAEKVGWLDVNFANIISLWPILIIIAGISILSTKNSLFKAIHWLVVISALVLVIWFGLYADKYMSVDLNTASDQSSRNQSIKKLDLTIKGGASQIKVYGSDIPEPSKVRLESNITQLEKTESVNNETQTVAYSLEGNTPIVFGGSITNKLFVEIARELETKLTIDAGASEIRADLSDVILAEALIKSGASDVEIKLGDRQNNALVTIDSGASNVVMLVPKSIGVKLSLDAGLSSREIADLTSKGDNIYESENYEQSEKRIEIKAKTGLSNFTLKRY